VLLEIEVAASDCVLKYGEIIRPIKS